MENLIINQTDITPLVDFNGETHVLKMTGESYPENAARFYDPVLRWIEAFMTADSNRAIVAQFELTMFNSSTAKILMDIVDALNDGAGKEKSITLIWLYHEINDLIEEFGNDLKEDYPDLTVVLTPVSD